jgi:hypothetical protein
MLENVPDEVDLTIADHVEWVKWTDEPEIWHAAAEACLHFLGDPHGFLPWLVQQPRMDRATAGWIFLWPPGSDYLKGVHHRFDTKLPKNAVVALFDALCARSETIGFTTDDEGLPAICEPFRQDCLAVVESGNVAPGVVVPMAIIGKPFKTPDRGAIYQVHDGLLVSARIFHAELPDIYGPLPSRIADMMARLASRTR